MKQDLWRVQEGRENSGIFLHIDREVPRNLRLAFMRFTNWIRAQYIFPVKVTVYIKSTAYILSRATGKSVAANIWMPYDLQKTACIKVSVGDFNELVRESDAFGATCSELCSLAHEITHYFQWQNGCDMDSAAAVRVNEQQARRKARRMVQKYIDTEDMRWVTGEE